MSLRNTVEIIETCSQCIARFFIFSVPGSHRSPPLSTKLFVVMILGKLRSITASLAHGTVFDNTNTTINVVFTQRLRNQTTLARFHTGILPCAS